MTAMKIYANDGSNDLVDSEIHGSFSFASRPANTPPSFRRFMHASFRTLRPSASVTNVSSFLNGIPETGSILDKRRRIRMSAEY
jgi:hypothetical protein